MSPEQVRALLVTELTGPRSLTPGVLDLPAEKGNVLIDVHAAGVTFPDLLMTHGKYQVKPDLPFAPGLEVAGIVRSAAEGTGISPGDRVIAFTGHGGGYASTVAVPPQNVVTIPDGMEMADGVSLMVNYQTSYFALVERGRLSADETVLIHGAAGGVGTAAIQIALGVGARVLAVVSDEGKARVARDAGAEEVILTDNWFDEVRRRAGSEGVDVVYDPVGGDRFDASVRLLRPFGRMLVIGFAEGRIPTIAANRLLLRNIDVLGVAWGHYVPHDPDLISRVGRVLNGMVQGGWVRPVVGATYALEDGARALLDLESRKTVGKSVLMVR